MPCSRGGISAPQHIPCPRKQNGSCRMVTLPYYPADRVVAFLHHRSCVGGFSNLCTRRVGGRPHSSKTTGSHGLGVRGWLVRLSRLPLCEPRSLDPGVHAFLGICGLCAGWCLGRCVSRMCVGSSTFPLSH